MPRAPGGPASDDGRIAGLTGRERPSSLLAESGQSRSVASERASGQSGPGYRLTGDRVDPGRSCPPVPASTARFIRVIMGTDGSAMQGFTCGHRSRGDITCHANRLGPSIAQEIRGKIGTDAAHRGIAPPDWTGTPGDDERNAGRPRPPRFRCKARHHSGRRRTLVAALCSWPPAACSRRTRRSMRWCTCRRA